MYDDLGPDELLSALESHFSDLDKEMKLRAKLFALK